MKKILKSSTNIKHKSILTLIYSPGLRRSELLNLRISDIDSEKIVINIKGAKAKKDRISLLSDKMAVLFRKYYKEYKPEKYLIEWRGYKRYRQALKTTEYAKT